MPMDLTELCMVPYVSYEGAAILSGYCDYERYEYAGQQPLCIFQKIVKDNDLWDPSVLILPPEIMAKLRKQIGKLKIPPGLLEMAKERGVILKKPKINLMKKRLRTSLETLSASRLDCEGSQLLLNTIRLVVDYANKMEAPQCDDLESLMSLPMMIPVSANGLMAIGITQGGQLNRPSTDYLYFEVYELWDQILKRADISPTEAQKFWASLLAVLLMQQDAPPGNPNDPNSGIGPGDWRIP